MTGEHAGFIEDKRLMLQKDGIDGASKDQRCKVFKQVPSDLPGGVLATRLCYGLTAHTEQDFRIELFFEPVQHSRIPYRKLEKASRAVREATTEMSVKMRQDLVEKKKGRTRQRSQSFAGDELVTPRLRPERVGSLRYQEDGFDLGSTSPRHAPACSAVAVQYCRKLLMCCRLSQTCRT